jgi:uncharacterized membrane protein
MTQTPDNMALDKSTSARTPLWLRIIFFLSLALNLLVAGLVIGHMLGDGPDRRVPRVDRMGGPMTFALSHEDRRAIGDALRKEYRENDRPRHSRDAQYRAFIAALRSDPYDAGRLADLLTDQREDAEERIALGHRLLLERISAMSAPDRAAFADRLEEGLNRRHDRDRPDHDRPERDGEGTD